MIRIYGREAQRVHLLSGPDQRQAVLDADGFVESIVKLMSRRVSMFNDPF